MHERGATLCSACQGLFLLAETGLFDGRDSTVHYNAAEIFAATYPAIPIHPARPLMISGAREELLSSGASVAWHDLALHLVARYAGSAAAQDVAKAFALQWHHEGFSPYVVFSGKSDHGDAEIGSAQKWLSQHFSVANPVEEMLKRSKLAERTFKRRFVSATGLAPIAYVQRLRIEDAKERLERTTHPWTRSAGASATRIPPSFDGSSSVRPALRPRRIGNAFAFPTSPRGNTGRAH